MKKNEPIQILVCYHKPSESMENQYIRPIQVGRKKCDVRLNEMIGDDTGENISARNKNYCELTALYWAWKNIDAQYYGLMHYRRFFDFTGQFDDTKCYGLDETVQQNLGLDARTIQSRIEECDVILPEKINLPLTLNSDSVHDEYCHAATGEDLKLLRAAVQSKAPHALEDYDTVLAGQEAYYFNMFVMRRDVFRQYATWLFSILFEVESQIDLRHRDDYQTRALGFMGERLLTVFIHHYQRVHGLRIQELPVIWVSDESPPGLLHAVQKARRRYIRLRIRRSSIHLKLFGWEFHRGKAA